MAINGNRRIKVAHIITRMDWGGAPDIVRILCAGMDTGRYEVSLVSGPTAHPSGPTSEFLRGFQGRTAVIPPLQREINPSADLRALAGLCRLLRAGNFDIVHTHTAKAGLLGRPAARIAGIKTVIHTPHGHNAYGYGNPVLSAAVVAVERCVSCCADAIIALTEREKREIVARHMAPASRVVVIPQGLELDAFTGRRISRDEARARLDIAPDELAIGMIGRLEKVKGADYFVDAARKVAARLPRARFLLVGDGSLRGKLQKSIDASGLASRCRLLGWREDVPQIISALDAVVLPSLNESVGIALIEAQVLGCPVVATRVGGIPDVVADGRTGILVEPGRSDLLADALERLMRDDRLRVRMGEDAARLMRGRFRVDDMIRAVSDLYMDRLNTLR